MKGTASKYWWCPLCLCKVSLPYANEWSRKCPDCKSELVLHVPQADSWETILTDLPGIWRYYNLLPLFSQQYIIPLGEGSMPPIESKKLAQLLGIHKLWLLPQSTNPTGTFKDLEASFIIAKCREWHLTRLCWHSTGNTARSYRHYALEAHIQNVSFYPLNCAYKWLGVSHHDDALLFAYDGPFQQISEIAKKFALEHGFVHIAPLAWKLEGKTAMAYQIAEMIPSTTLIVQTIAGGYGVLGMNLGFERLHQAGLFKRPTPRFGLFQIAGADTISRLLQSNKEITAMDLQLPLNPFEPTLQSTNPMSTYRYVRDVVLRTGSFIQTVEPHEVELYAEDFKEECDNLSIPVSYQQEKSPFISWAGLVRRSLEGILSANEEILFIITGSRKTDGTVPAPDSILTPVSHSGNPPA